MIGSQHLFITILGSSKTGKSSIVRNFLGNKYDGNIDEDTIEDTFRKIIKFQEKEFCLKIIDIGCPLENKNIVEEWLPISDAFVFVYDAKNPSTLDELKEIVENVISKRGKTCGMIVVSAKSEGKLRVTVEKGKELADSIFGDFVETSSKDGLNIQELFQKLIKNTLDKRPKFNELAYLEKPSLQSDSPTLVLIHGLNSSKETWTNIFNSKNFENVNLVAIDLQGHGESPIQNHDFSTEQMVKDLENFFTQKKIDSFYLLGHSMGVRVVIPYASIHPKRIKGLILEDMILTQREKKDLTSDEWENLKLYNRKASSKERLFKDLIKYGYDQERIEKWIQDGRVKEKNRIYHSGIHPYVAQMSYLYLINTKDSYYHFKKLEDLNFPVLLLRAEKYSPMDDLGTQEMRDLCEKMEYHFIKGSEHSIHKNDSEFKFIKLIKNFIKV